MNLSGRAMGPALCTLLLVSMAPSACVEWLEVTPPDADAGHAPPAVTTRAVTGPPATLRGASWAATGPVVPGTPGKRVPEGYWTRVRLDEADVLIPHTWASFQATTTGGFLRIVASGTDPMRPPTTRAVLELSLPEGAHIEDLEGLPFGEASLRGSTIGVRLGEKHLWTVSPTRVSLDRITPSVLHGTLEGHASRGAQSPRVRKAYISFIALRSPQPRAANDARAGK